MIVLPFLVFMFSLLSFHPQFRGDITPMDALLRNAVGVLLVVLCVWLLAATVRMRRD